MVVTRPTRWGNPFPSWDRYTAAVPYVAHIQALGEAFRVEIRQHLAGKHLACCCPPHQPRHADVLLYVANTIPDEEEHLCPTG